MLTLAFACCIVNMLIESEWVQLDFETAGLHGGHGFTHGSAQLGEHVSHWLGWQLSIVCWGLSLSAAGLLTVRVSNSTKSAVTIDWFTKVSSGDCTTELSSPQYPAMYWKMILKVFGVAPASDLI